MIDHGRAMIIIRLPVPFIIYVAIASMGATYDAYAVARNDILKTYDVSNSDANENSMLIPTVKV